MKTTIELPENTFRKAKLFAAGQGITLKQLFTRALEEFLTPRMKKSSKHEDKPWMAGFGKLAYLSEENRRILDLIEEEFEVAYPEEDE